MGFKWWLFFSYPFIRLKGILIKHVSRYSEIRNYQITCERKSH